MTDEMKKKLEEALEELRRNKDEIEKNLSLETMLRRKLNISGDHVSAYQYALLEEYREKYRVLR